jgi:hypothetical protein
MMREVWIKQLKVGDLVCIQDTSPDPSPTQVCLVQDVGPWINEIGLVLVVDGKPFHSRTGRCMFTSDVFLKLVPLHIEDL